MSNKLFIEFDNTLKKSEIIIPIQQVDKEDIDSNSASGNKTNIDQTKVYGIVSPLIMINSTVIDFNSIINFDLKSVGLLPTLSMTISDNNRLITNIDKPGVDNEVRVQILPAFDNIYKKINLTFYISNISVNDNIVNVQCIYKVPKLYESCLKAFGKISTYELCREIALESKLGFMTNIGDNGDYRYIYSPNYTYLELLEYEIARSDSHEQILDVWIDLFDNLNLVDVKERYTSVDNNEDMKIWVSSQPYDTFLDNEDNENEPTEAPAIISNHPGLNSSELYVKEIVNKIKTGTNVSTGTDMVYTTYNDILGEHSDYLIQNGNIKRDKFIKHTYLGECYGDYNYLLAKPLRECYLNKIKSEIVSVTLPSPVFGLIRGGKVNLVRYITDDIINARINNLEEIEVGGEKVVDRKGVISNINLDEYELNDNTEGTDTYRLDRNVSGQYLIYGVEIKYKGLSSKQGWEYKLNLVKPASKPIILIDPQE